MAIGTVAAAPNDGQGGNALTINFNTADATPARVQTLLQNLRWSAAAGTGAQTFTATLNDGDGTANGGASTTTANFTMTLGNAPTLGGGFGGLGGAGGLTGLCLHADMTGSRPILCERRSGPARA